MENESNSRFLGKLQVMSDSKSKVLSIIGQGYVGLPLAMAAVEAGWEVLGIDKSAEKVAEINSGHSPIEDVSDKQLLNAISSKNYFATTDFSRANRASVVTFCVPTPLDADRKPDLGPLRDAALSVAPFLEDGTLVISESTSYPGTLRKLIIPLIEEVKKDKSFSFFYASAPERVNPGDLIWSQRNTPRLVGGIGKESQERALAFYSSICESVIEVESPEVAEAAKLLENTFRLVNIALINEFAQLCGAEGIDVNSVVKAASSKPFGFMPFKPGIGVGGHCIPVDPLYLTWWADQMGQSADIVKLADSINRSMPAYIASRAMGLVGSNVKKPKVLIFGVSYKADIADVRDTPVLELINQLVKEGAEVIWHDPLVREWQGGKSVDLPWVCDVAVLATNHSAMNLTSLIESKIPILDCTNTLPKQTNIHTI